MTVVLRAKRVFGSAHGLMLACLFAVAAVESSFSEQVNDELPPGLEGRHFELVFSDNFDALEMSPDGSGKYKWFNGLWYSGPAPSQLFSVSNGALKLLTRGEKGALISTISPKKDGYGTTFSYGYFEARLAMSAKKSSWPAFWLFSQEHARGTDGNHWCEIDIFELFDSNKFGGTVHEWINFKNHQNKNNLVDLPPGTDVTRWHTYGMLWEPNRVTWFFDRKPLMTAAVPPICQQQSMFLILNTNTHDPSVEQFLLVDWVRVYMRKL